MEALKITEKIILENAFEHKKKKALIGLRTTGPWTITYIDVAFAYLFFLNISFLW